MLPPASNDAFTSEHCFTTTDFVVFQPCYVSIETRYQSFAVSQMRLVAPNDSVSSSIGSRCSGNYNMSLYCCNIFKSRLQSGPGIGQFPVDGEHRRFMQHP